MIVKHTQQHQDAIGNVSAPSLKRNELTPAGKRRQLWGKGVRGADADKIIEDLYGPQNP